MGEDVLLGPTRKIELSPDVTLNVVADNERELAASDKLIALHRDEMPLAQTSSSGEERG